MKAFPVSSNRLYLRESRNQMQVRGDCDIVAFVEL